MITVNDRKEFLEAVDDYLPSRPVCVEIGVFNGDFSQMILDILYPSFLILVDPFMVGNDKYKNGFPTSYSTDADYIAVLNRFKKELDSGVVSIDRNYSYDAVHWYKGKSISLIYHDGSHLYEDLKRDLNEWLPKMKDNSLICGHDYLECEDFGVIKAVNEFMEEHGFEMVVFNQNGGDWALKRK